MEERLSAALGATWMRNLATREQRVAAQESAIVAFLAGTLDTAGRQMAASEAHKLAGKFGSFGVEAGSQVASELESAWSAAHAIDVARMAQLVASLRQHMQEHRPSRPGDATAFGKPVESHKPVNVLLVDDDQVFADFALSVLRRRQYEVSWLPNGEAARAALCDPDSSLRPRLMLLGVEMPGLDGFALLEDVALSELDHQCPVIMLTRRRAAEDIVRAHRLGVVDYLAKPLAAPTLIQRVQRALA